MLLVYYSQSSSIIFTVVWLGLMTVTPLGSEDGSIERVTLSLSSTILSSIIETLNTARVSPAGNVISNGPES